MRDEFGLIAREFLAAKNAHFSQNELAKYVREDATEAVRSALDLLEPALIVKGSAGQGGWADVPWAAVFDPVVTTKATDGYYIVYLFAANMETLYLSLNQGTISVFNEFKRSGYVDELRRRAGILKARAPEYEDYFTDAPINLASSADLPRGYEAGHAFGLSYDTNAIPNDGILETDLSKMIELYFKATARGGVEASESHHIAEHEADLTKITEQRRYSYHRRIDRNAIASKKAKQQHGYRCQACDFDFEKTYGKLGKEYIEAHHLTPLSELPEGEPVSLDPVKDFAVLCSNCHRMIHRKKSPKNIQEFRAILKNS